MRRREVRDLVIAWLVLSLSLSMGSLLGLLSGSFLGVLVAFSIALIAVGTHFVFHEMAHKLVAQRFGYWAEFRLWPMGLFLALAMALISSGRFIFAAPGAVYIIPPFWRFEDSKKENGAIGLVGPLVNIALSIIFFLLALAQLGPVVDIIAVYGYSVGLMLASFNLIPIPPLDGYNVFRWKPLVWALVALPTWGFMFLSGA